jgi:pyridinium-3,5-bisthiocarboxylic acid mononucleotide nickel chelatase
MLLAALIDAGCPVEAVEEAVRSCGADVRLRVDEVHRAGIRAALLRIDEAPGEPARTLPELLDAVAAARLPGAAGARAARVLESLGATEGFLHGAPPGEVHLHELSGVDTLVDVVGFCVALTVLGVDEVHASPLPAAPGSVVTEHGDLPLPAPATLALLAAAGAPLLPGTVGVEHVTPTAAALLCSLASFVMPALRLRRVGHGAGARDDQRRPNIVRCWLGDPLPTAAAAPAAAERFDDPCVELRTNLDDASPAVVAAVAARCLEAGALDSWVVAATMKKGRPGHILHVLVPRGAEAAIGELLLAESPTLGVRRTEAARMTAGRDTVVLSTALGAVRVKRKLVGGRVVDAQPEPDECARIAREQGIPLHRAVAELTAAARAALATPPDTEDEA